MDGLLLNVGSRNWFTHNQGYLKRITEVVQNEYGFGNGTCMGVWDISLFYRYCFWRYSLLLDGMGKAILLSVFIVVSGFHVFRFE
jgi:hypothetical protein